MNVRAVDRQNNITARAPSEWSTHTMAHIDGGGSVGSVVWCDVRLSEELWWRRTNNTTCMRLICVRVNARSTTMRTEHM